MDQTKFQENLNSVGAAILEDDFFSRKEWEQIALVVSVAANERSYEGFIYVGDKHEPASPDRARPISKPLLELQAAMTPPGEAPWKQALIHITKPGPQINIQFEYDDPKRWSLKEVSLDTTDYAQSLRPSAS